MEPLAGVLFAVLVVFFPLLGFCVFHAKYVQHTDHACDFSNHAINGHHYAYGYPELYDTEPLGDLSGQNWTQSAEGQQYFHVSMAMGRVPNNGVIAGLDAPSLGYVQSGAWGAQHSGVDAALMERFLLSQTSRTVMTPSASWRTSSSDQPQSVELRASLSSMSFHISSGQSEHSFNMHDNAGLYPDSPPYTDGQVCYEAYPEDAIAPRVHGSLRNGVPHSSLSGLSRLMTAETDAYGAFSTSPEHAMLYTSPSDIMPGVYFAPSVSPDNYSPAMESLQLDDQPLTWSGNEQPGSGVSSPSSHDMGWNSSVGNNYITSAQGLRTNGQSTVPRNGQISVEATAVYHEASGLYSTRTGGQGQDHGSTDSETNPRSHRLYQNPIQGPDGLYHCPWEGKDASCNHKPEKLKCNYDKFVDSHLKPYRCKVVACENARFSSTACLLRHEREAHAMHGHGEKPFLCTSDGCERSQPGNGFPRHWNLCDHMKRVHNQSPSPSTGTTKLARNGKKRKVESQATTSKAVPVATKTSSRPARSASISEEIERCRQMLNSVPQDADLSDPAIQQRFRATHEVLGKVTTSMPSQRGKSSIKQERHRTS